MGTSTIVGVTCHFQYSFFSHGQGQAALAIAEVLKAHGNTVVLIGTNGKQSWWDDVKGLQGNYTVKVAEDIKEPELDLLVDIDGHQSVETRSRIAKKTVMLWRKTPILMDMEPTIYPMNIPKRELRGLSAIWTYDHFEECDIRYIQMLSGIPVVKVPFIWTPLAIEAQRHESKFPDWSQTAEMMKQITTWDCHICETNTSCTSSATIPLVALCHAKKHTNFPIANINVHSAEHIKGNEFFQKNILEHVRVDGVTTNFVGRQRCMDWVVHAKGWVLSHLRFLHIRPYLLDLAWCGIPTVHNSTWLRDIDTSLGAYYYNDNSLTGATSAMWKMVNQFEAREGFFAVGSLQKIRENILKWVSVRMSSGVWSQAVQIGLQAVPKPIEIVEKPVEVPPVEKPLNSAEKVSSVKTVRIVFTDMWDDFNVSYNFFTLMLQEASKTLSIQIEGHSPQTYSGKPDLVVFGPFGENWKAYDSSIPKVHYTGENTPPVLRDDVKLNLTFENTSGNDTGKIRLPLWMLEIDWFGADLERIVNPKPLPLDSCCKVDEELLKKKEKFCAFVVTNPSNPVRNNAFAWLNMYKKVDSAGRLFNNMGDVIFAGRGGGGGELKKHKFLQDYKFCFAYENNSASGYTTEKILHAKAAGCVPIYWGDPEIGRDFDVKGFLNAQDCNTPEQLIDAVKALDTDPEAWRKMAAVPALDEYRRDLVRRRLSETARQMLLLATGQEYGKEIPRFLGATTTAEANSLALARGEKLSSSSSPTPTVVGGGKSVYSNAVVATFASKAFWDSLCQWLETYSHHRKGVPGLKAHIFLANDIAPVSVAFLQEKYPFAQFEFIPTETPSDFKDLWEPQHFAWKIWVYKSLVAKSEYKDHCIWYTDAGSVQVRWPVEYLEKVAEKGICVLEDSEQFNSQWCHKASRECMNITEAELAQKQIVGGLMSFIGGSPVAKEFFEEAWKYAQIRDCVVGEKWSGLGVDGKPYGHRHDQSILSIISLRRGLSRYPLEKVYGDKSMRRTFKEGKAIYVHRGRFALHTNFVPRIGEVHLINLDRREDRYKKFLDTHSWGKHVIRDSACDGRKMKLTPSLARLLKPNDFLWKKAIAGCAMSHLKLWMELATENNVVENYLILEDDVQFKEGWLETVWAEAAKTIPEDYDILYLGGVLPPNKTAFYGCLEKVNSHWSRVAPNQIFGQPEPTRYFHFCNYSYIMKRETARKLLESIHALDGYTTSADHMICNKVQQFKHYVLMPQVAGCYQDNDPKYQTSAFNNFNRVDGFDSDLWNNDERFSQEEIDKALGVGAPLDLVSAITDAFPVVLAPTALEKPVATKRKFYTIEPFRVKMSELLEFRWLQYLIDDEMTWEATCVSVDHEPLEDCPVFIVQRPHCEAYTAVFARYEALKKPFAVLHLSDEFLKDSTEFYSFSMCKGVIRNYARPDLPQDVKSKVITIPLGYAKHAEGHIDAAWVETPAVPFRDRVWTFYGTDWQGRASAMEVLKAVGPNHSRFFKNWMDAEQLKESEYVGTLLNSVFVPCPGGMNAETYRFWEALEHGAIPLYVRCPGDEGFVASFQGSLGILNLPSWQHGAAIMANLMNDKETLEAYRTQLLTQWSAYKNSLMNRVQSWIRGL